MEYHATIKNVKICKIVIDGTEDVNILHLEIIKYSSYK